MITITVILFILLLLSVRVFYKEWKFKKNYPEYSLFICAYYIAAWVLILGYGIIDYVINNLP